MKVFISQPMNGKTDVEIFTDRQTAIEEIADSELAENSNGVISIVDSLIDEPVGKDGLSGNQIGLKYLAKSLELLAEADVAYFCNGWSSARGCKIEHSCCEEYHIPIYGHKC